ncbi:MAG: acyltransferase [Candidatus Eisenbacteria bacterium]|nr:acyltransferase [Candidatus Eisenbacteria bacterium]
MRIAVYQTSPAYGEVEYNLFTALNALGSFRADLFVLPELFSTGYLFGSRKELAALAEPIPSGPTTRALLEFCRAEDCAVVAGIAEVSGRGSARKYFNSAVFLGPRGLLGRYRKTHLFNLEKKWFDAGDSGFSVSVFRGARIGVMICFDWVYPEVVRILALKGADIVCHPSNLVLPFCQAAMITRSIENRVFTVTANRVGKEKRGEVEIPFSGMSQIVDPHGRVLRKAPRTGEKLIAADVDPTRARDKRFTPGNDLFKDRRPRFYRDLVR